jgi:hypothetical protein
VEHLDETGTPEERAAVARILKPKLESRMEREHVRETIESAGWRIFFERAIAQTLAAWEGDLLNRADLPDDQRRGMVLARLALIDAVVRMYERVYGPEYVERVPQWLKQEMR